MPEVTAELAKRIMKATFEKAYARTHPIMDEIMASDHRLEILSQILPKLPGSSVTALFLCNLDQVMKFSLDDYRQLYGLISGHDVAIFDLTVFLVDIGGIRGEQIRNFYLDCPTGMFEHEVVFVRFKDGHGDDMALDASEISIAEGEERLFKIYFEEYDVSEGEILTFREHLQSLRLGHPSELRQPKD